MITETEVVHFDWAINNLLRDKANFDVLEGFLSAVLGEEVEVIKILDNASNQPDALKNFNRADILIKDKKQRQILVEIQNHQEIGYMERILWGVSKLIVDTLPESPDYHNISKVISISILYFNFGLEDDYVYYGVNEFSGLHTQKNLVFRQLNPESKKLERRYSKEVFPEYYLISVERFKDVITSDLDEWIYLLKHSALRADFKSKNIDKAREKLALLKLSPEERKSYKNYIQTQLIEDEVLETARSEGLQEGLEQGVEQGQEKAKLEIARKLLDQGMDIEMIAAMTGLSVELINIACVGWKSEE
ncbi:MAG: Rpn family recombination-promoting nuclease/putative transposase [Pseudomonadota bacterium]